MTKEQAKVEAQRIFNKHFFNDVDLAKIHAILEVQSNIDLLEKIQSQYKNVINLVCSVEIRHLKQFKQAIEKL